MNIREKQNQIHPLLVYANHMFIYTAT